MAKRGGRKGGGMNAGKELKTFLRNRMWRQHWYILVAVVGVAVALFSAAIFRFSMSEEHIYSLDVENTPMMARVFQSGEPWVVLCSKPDDKMPSVFSDASRQLVNKSFVGVLDCSQKLPTSKKSVFARFRLRRGKRNPTVFTVANGLKPQQIPREFLQSAKALHQRVLTQTSKRAVEIRNQKDIKTKCLDRATCVLVLRGRKYKPYETQWLARLMGEHRVVQFAVLDATKWELDTEADMNVPEFVEGEHRMVLFKRGKDAKGKRAELRIKPYNNVFELLPVQQFLEEHLGGKLKTISTMPTLVRRKPDEAAKHRAERRADRKKRREQRREENRGKKFDKKTEEDVAEEVEPLADERRHEEEEEEVLDLDTMDDDEGQE